MLNATTLNTGHNWQFGVTWMGEPPYTVSNEAGSAERLRRMYYWETPERYRRVRLGQAVAASSCVPLLFEPVALPGLYPDRTVQLVDGGVHDNQGTASLLEQECTVMLVSDASGQMGAEHRPSPELLGVPLRANAIFQTRLREAELVDLQARRRASVLRGLLFLHLKMDLDSPPVDWIRAETAPAEPRAAAAQASKTVYGIDREAQAAMAELRTDLDSFNDQEAAALMLSGYRMASHYLCDALPVIPPSTGAPDWWFLQMTRQLEGASPPASERLWTLRLLRAGKCRGFRSMRIVPVLNAAITLLMLAGVVSWLWWIGQPNASAAVVFFLVTLLLSVALMVAPVGLLLRWARVKSLSQFAIGLLSVPGVVFAGVQMAVFDPLYLYLGRIPTFGAKPVSTTGVIARVTGFLLLMTLLAAGPWIPSGWTEWQVMRERQTALELQSEKRYAAALPIWDSLLSRRPDDAEALRHRGLAYSQIANWDKAIQDYASLDRVNGLNLRDYKQRAYARMKAGDLNGARDDYNRAIAANPDDQESIAQRNAIEKLLPTPEAKPSRDALAVKPRVYIQVATDRQKTDVAAIAVKLRALGYDVPPIQVVGSRAPSKTQVRMAKDDQNDRNKAAGLVEQLRGLGINAEGPNLFRSEKARPNHFELWIAPESVAGVVKR